MGGALSAATGILMGIDYSAQWGKNGVGAWQLLESGWGNFNISAFVQLDFFHGDISI